MGLDLTDLSPTDFSATTLEINGIGNIWIIGFALNREGGSPNYWDIHDERELWDDYKNGQAATFVYDSNSSVKRYHNGLIFGGTSNTNNTFASRYQGLLTNKNYRVQFKYKTINNQGGIPYIGFRRYSDPNTWIAYYPLSISSSWVTDYKTIFTGSFDDIEIVFGSNGEGTHAINYTWIYSY